MSQKRFLRVIGKKGGAIHAYLVSQIIYYIISRADSSGFRTLRIMHERCLIGEMQSFYELDYDISDFVNESQLESALVVTNERQVEI